MISYVISIDLTEYIYHTFHECQYPFLRQRESGIVMLFIKHKAFREQILITVFT